MEVEKSISKAGGQELQDEVTEQRLVSIGPQGNNGSPMEQGVESDGRPMTQPLPPIGPGNLDPPMEQGQGRQDEVSLQSLPIIGADSSGPLLNQGDEPLSIEDKSQDLTAPPQLPNNEAPDRSDPIEQEDELHNEMAPVTSEESTIRSPPDELPRPHPIIPGRNPFASLNETPAEITNANVNILRRILANDFGPGGAEVVIVVRRNGANGPNSRRAFSSRLPPEYTGQLDQGVSRAVVPDSPTITGAGSTMAGTASTVTGTGSTPTGTRSVATSTDFTATGTGSTRAGTGSTATSTGSTATGIGSAATSTGSIAASTGSTTTGTSSTAARRGMNSTATGMNSTAAGTGSTAGTGLTATRTSSAATSTKSTAAGTGSTATGTNSTEAGTSSTAETGLTAARTTAFVARRSPPVPRTDPDEPETQAGITRRNCPRSFSIFY